MSNNGAEVVSSRADVSFDESQIARSSPPIVAPGSELNSFDQGGFIYRSDEFVSGFQPLDYVMDGVLQRRYLYSLTAQTGAGKTAFLLQLATCVALGKRFGRHEVTKGRVLYLAGENPDDIRMRWIASCDFQSVDPAAIEMYFIPHSRRIRDIEKLIVQEARKIGEFALVIIDTAAAYFDGDDENSNPQFGNYARSLRRLTKLPGGPCVLVACHPTKNGDSLIPRGAGAFLAEVDGNLAASKSGTRVTINWQGKFRGASFEPFAFELEQVTSFHLKDSRGRLIPSVIAIPLTGSPCSGKTSTASGEEILALLVRNGGSVQLSIARLCEELGCLSTTGAPQKSTVHRTLSALTQDGLIVRGRRSGLELTTKGWKEAKRLGLDGATPLTAAAAPFGT